MPLTRLSVTLKDRLEHQAVGGKLFFAPPKLSTDNAVGIAWLGLSTLRRESHDPYVPLPALVYSVAELTRLVKDNLKQTTPLRERMGTRDRYV